MKTLNHDNMKNQKIAKVLLRAKRPAGCELIFIDETGTQTLIPFANSENEGKFMKQAAVDNACSSRFLDYLSEKGVELSQQTINRIAVLKEGAILLKEPSKTEPITEDLDFEDSESIWNGPPPRRGLVVVIFYLLILALITYVICYFAAQAKIAQLNSLEIPQ